MKTKVAIILSTSLSVLALDQLSKYLVEKFLPYGVPVEVISHYVRFTFIYNPYTAFGISLGENFPYTLVASLVSMFVLYLALKERNTLNTFAYSLILGGALGNILDRIVRGKVVDFVDVGINEHLRWFIFNLADACITIAIAILLVESYLRKRGT